MEGAMEGAAEGAVEAAMEVREVVRSDAARRFLERGPIAVIGASDSRGNFGRTVYEALRDRGLRPVAVNPNTASVAGDRCAPSVAAIPEPVDRAIVMLPAPLAAEAVEALAGTSVSTVWLFRGFGAGADAPEVRAACRRLGLDVVPGACPLMFLEPVGAGHRLHRRARRLRGAVDRPSPRGGRDPS